MTRLRNFTRLPPDDDGTEVEDAVVEAPPPADVEEDPAGVPEAASSFVIIYISPDASEDMKIRP